MKHAGAAALDRLEDLLAAIRRRSCLREKARGVFYLKSRAFLHFHEDPAGLFADIRAASDADFVRLRVDDAAGRAALLEKIDHATGG
jgi:hypothetical protein